MKMIMVAVAAASFVAMPVADAGAKHTKRHAHHAEAPVQPTTMKGFSQQGPARMIEVRPGLWISSYGCVADEGYGRYSPCDVGSRSN